MFSNFASNLSQKKVQKPEMKFVEISHHENNFCQHIMSVDRNCRRLIRRQNGFYFYFYFPLQKDPNGCNFSSKKKKRIGF